MQLQGNAAASFAEMVKVNQISPILTQQQTQKKLAFLPCIELYCASQNYSVNFFFLILQPYQHGREIALKKIREKKCDL